MLSPAVPTENSKVAVIGLGYVGLPLVLELVKAGRQVVGVDISERRITLLQNGESYVDDISNVQLKEVVSTGRVKFTTQYSEVTDCEVLNICVPTPLRQSRDPDTSCIESAMKEILKFIHKGSLVILESTTYPGTTRDLVVKPLEAKGFTVGKDVFVVFSPERIDPGNLKYGLKNTPKVVGGVTPLCLEHAVKFYNGVVDQVVKVDTPEEAEMVKLLENTFRAVNIALVNEFSLLSDRMGINFWNVIDGAKSKPFGFMPFYPGPGIGGHCIPLDPVYLGWRAKSFDFFSRFIETASDINANMPRMVIQKLAREANARGILLKGAKIVVGGIAYKPGIRDARESPALPLIRLLVEELKADVSYLDPLVEHVEAGAMPQGVRSLSMLEAEAMKPDVFILVTPHAGVEWRQVAAVSKLTFDTRNALKNPTGQRFIKL